MTDATPPPRKLSRLQQWIKDREAVFSDVAQMQGLRNASAAVVDYIYNKSDDNSRFVKGTGNCEWILRDRNWVALTFSYGLSKKKLHISLDVWPGNLDKFDELEIKQGRVASWSRITLERLEQFPAVMHHLKYAAPRQQQ